MRAHTMLERTRMRFLLTHARTLLAKKENFRKLPTGQWRSQSDSTDAAEGTGRALVPSGAFCHLDKAAGV